jgi:hypothetical protein
VLAAGAPTDHEFLDGVLSDATVRERIDLAGAQLATLLLSRVVLQPPELMAKLAAGAA